MMFPDGAGLYLSIVDGVMKDEEIMIRCIDNLHYPFRDFIDHAQSMGIISFEPEDCFPVPRLYILAGHQDKVLQAEKVWIKELQQTFNEYLQSDQILKRIQREINKTTHYCLESMYWLYSSQLMNFEDVFYPRVRRYTFDDGLELSVFYWTFDAINDSANEVEQTISFWLGREYLFLKGYQCFNRSFILRNMVGRKILAAFPDRSGDWGMLLEGGIFFPLKDNFEVGLSKLNSMHIVQWTIGEVEENLLDPIYAFGYGYQHSEIIYEWLYVFIYVLVTMEEDLVSTIDLEQLYFHYCEYLGSNICPYVSIDQKIIEITQFLAVFKRKLNDIREYLKGGEETGVSKNILLMMRTRKAYLPAVYQFIYKNTELRIEDIHDYITFDTVCWNDMLSNLERTSSTFEKGTQLEELAEYFIHTMPGLKVTDVRSKRGRAEVDIYCCNVSLDASLWKLGALILIECKNRKNKVAVSDIRSLVATMEAKGIIGAVIFSRIGFTSVAMEEIYHQLTGGKMIISISVHELKEVGEVKEAYDLVREKVESLEKCMENEIRQMYF